MEECFILFGAESSTSGILQTLLICLVGRGIVISSAWKPVGCHSIMFLDFEAIRDLVAEKKSSETKEIEETEEATQRLGLEDPVLAFL